jgi:hypothetical protein
MGSMRRREADHILKLCLGDHLRAYEVVERQLSLLVLRAHVLIALSILVITATGLTGHALAATSRAAYACVATGIAALLAAAAVAGFGVLRLRWLSQEIDDEPVITLLRGIELRDRRARYLRISFLLWSPGFALYCAAIAQLVLATLPAN